MLMPGEVKLAAPSVWKSPGIVKLVLVPTVGGLMINPLTDMLEDPAMRSISLVVEIVLTVIVVELRNRSCGGIGVPVILKGAKMIWKA